MEEKLVQILEQVTRLYLKYGIKSVTMDDVARELGISKKTLYQYVADKPDLVEKVVSYHMKCQNDKFGEFIDKNKNAIDTLLEISKHISNFLKDITPNIRYDLQKYYPSILKMHMDYRRHHMIDNIKSNLQKGMDQGLYRKDINIDVVAKLYVSRIELLFDQDFFPFDEYPTNVVFDEMFKYHIHGIASKKGIEHFESRLNTQE